jgi:hypothetical protein
VIVSADFSAIPESRHAAEIERLCDAMDAADRAGRYPRLIVERPWSAHNPELEGEFASPRAIRWYLERELSRLAAHGARISVSPGRKALDLNDPALGPAIDETRWDLRRKKLFLFAPERMALSIDRLEHYTGTAAETFQRYVLLTNYAWHLEEFRAALPDCIGPDSDGRQMPAWHYALPGRTGLTMVNIGVGPSNAKTLTDHLAVLRPDLVLMIGHCAGRERIPLPDPHRYAARRQRQAPARLPQIQRGRPELLRRQPPPARRDSHRGGGEGETAVPRRPAHRRPTLTRRAATWRHQPRSQPSPGARGDGGEATVNLVVGYRPPAAGPFLPPPNSTTSERQLSGTSRNSR